MVSEDKANKQLEFIKSKLVDLLKAAETKNFDAVEETGEIKQGFCKCPFCSRVFIARADLDKHMAAFGNYREQHEEAYRRVHDRA